MGAIHQPETSALSHPFAAVYNAKSKALVLGSFPSVKSRENAFYYGHPQNRFWRLLSELFNEPFPDTITAKTALLHAHAIALWDVVNTCTIQGSADSTLKPQKLNDIVSLLRKTDIHTIFANGKTAGRLYQSNLEKQTGIPIIILPSTSPANAVWTFQKLKRGWQPLADAVNQTVQRG